MIRHRILSAAPYVVGAFLVSLIGVGFLLAQLLSPDSLIWTGRCVPGTEEGGLVYYSVNGQQYAANDPLTAANAPKAPATACYDPRDPQQAVVPHTVTRVFEASSVLVPFAVAGLIVVLGLVIRPRRWKDIDVEIPWPTIGRRD